MIIRQDKAEGQLCDDKIRRVNGINGLFDAYDN